MDELPADAARIALSATVVRDAVTDPVETAELDTRIYRFFEAVIFGEAAVRAS